MSDLSQFQALVTGAVAGALMRTGAEANALLIDSEVMVDQNGDYTNMIRVTGRVSGEQLLVTVERIEE